MARWIAVSDEVHEHPSFARETFTEVQAWIWLLHNAAWKETRVRVGRGTITLQRGQCAFAGRFLAVKWGWSPSKVRRFTDKLEIDALVTTKATRDTTVITICKYDKFQPGQRPGAALSNVETPTETPSGAQTTRQPAHITTCEHDQNQPERRTDETQTGGQVTAKRRKEEQLNHLTTKPKEESLPQEGEGGARARDPGEPAKPAEPAKPEAAAKPKAKPKAAKPVSVPHVCPPEWEPTPEHHALGDELGFTPRQVREAASAMRDWSLSGGNKKLDWNATFRNWMRRDADRRSGGSRPQQKKPVSWADIANAARGKF